MFSDYGLLLLMSLSKLFMNMWVSNGMSFFLLLIFSFYLAFYCDILTIVISGFKVVGWDSCCSFEIDNKRHWRCCTNTSDRIRDKSVLCCQPWRWTPSDCSRGKWCYRFVLLLIFHCCWTLLHLMFARHIPGVLTSAIGSITWIHWHGLKFSGN